MLSIAIIGPAQLVCTHTCFCNKMNDHLLFSQGIWYFHFDVFIYFFIGNMVFGITHPIFTTTSSNMSSLSKDANSFFPIVSINFFYI